MLKTIKQWLGGRNSAPQPDPMAGQAAQQPLPELGPVNVRRFQTAQTNRMNSGIWATATSDWINAELAQDLETLVARCVFESTNNPIVSGVIGTHSADVITPSGPTLNIQTENESFNRVVQDEWQRWFESPEIGGTIDGVSLCRRWMAQIWDKGNVTALFTSDAQVSREEIQLRLLDFDPRRLKTPYEHAGDEQVTLGVRLNEQGRPLQYYIERYDQNSQYPHYTSEFDGYSPDEFLHAFESKEPGQVVGFPKLTPAIEEIGQLRRYDTEVLDAATAAANNGQVASTTNPEAEYKVPTSGSLEFERGQIKWLPPTYQLQQMQPHQPIAEYGMFRHEKLRALGRIANMPLLMVLLSAEQSNFSQSRIDLNVIYERGLRVQRRWFEQQILNRIFWQFFSELKLLRRRGRMVLPEIIDSFRPTWFWEPMPQADELKAMQAKALKRSLGLTNLDMDLSELGIDIETFIEQSGRVKAALAAAGIELPTPTNSSQPNETQQATSTN